MIQNYRPRILISIKRERQDDNNRAEVKKESFISGNKPYPQIAGISVETRNPLNYEPLVNNKAEIKHEEKKQVLLKNSNSSSSRYATYHCSQCQKEMPNLLTVLQHRTAVHGILFYFPTPNRVKHIDLTPDVLDPNYYCKSCEKTLSSNYSYRQHLKSTHHMKLVAMIPTSKNVSEPDPNNTDYYCCSCERHYSSPYKYRNHLKKLHKMEEVELRKSKRRKNPDILPDWQDPNNYCRSCQHVYSTKSAFKLHCRTYHHMKPPKVKRLNRNDPNFYCSECDITFINKSHLSKHCRFFHPRKKKAPSTNVVPNISDPNNYCKSCEKFFCDKNSYVDHLQYMHRILGPPSFPIKPTTSTPINGNVSKFLCCECGKTLETKKTFKLHSILLHSKYETEKNAEELPDADDPNFQCRICETKHHEKPRYRMHLRTVHRMHLKPLRTQHNPNFLPDHLSKTPYCRSCDRTYASTSIYRNHCKQFHKMTWSPFVCPDAEIDINSPDFYCAKCNTHLKLARTFKDHLKNTHKLDLIKEH